MARETKRKHCPISQVTVVPVTTATYDRVRRLAKGRDGERESSKVIGTTLNGRFRLEKELGRGGMGAVYRAIDTVLERSVAIKVLKDLTGEEVGRRIRLEAQILAR